MQLVLTDFDARLTVFCLDRPESDTTFCGKSNQNNDNTSPYSLTPTIPYSLTKNDTSGERTMVVETSDSLLRQLHYLALVVRRAGGSPFLEARRLKLPGGGTEVTALRDYAPGDDPKGIDWIGCARRDELQTRLYEGELDPRTYVLVDCSRSMSYAEPGGPTKFDVARRIAALLTYLALDRNDRVVAAAFDEGLAASSPVLCHKSRMTSLFRMLDSINPSEPGEADQGTNLRQMAEQFTAKPRRPGPVVILSDFLDPAGYETCFDILLRQGHQPRVVQIFTPSEADPSLLGDMEFTDLESGGATRKTTVTRRAMSRYRKVFGSFLGEIREACTRRAMRCLQISTDVDEDDILRIVLQGTPRADRQPFTSATFKK